MQVAGLNCTAWVMNQSHSLHVKEMMQALPEGVVRWAFAKLLRKAMTSVSEATMLRDLPVWWFSWDVQASAKEGG